MTATKFLAIYSQPKKMLRRKLIFAYAHRRMEWWMYDEDYLDPRHLLPGEDFVLLDAEHWWRGHDELHTAIDDAILAKHGVRGIMPGDPRGRCAVFDPDTGRVDRVIMADDELDTVAGMVLKNDCFVDKGDIYDRRLGVFRKPLRLVPRRRQLMASTPLSLAA